MSGSERKEQRLSATYSQSSIISVRAYNMIITAVTLYGLLMNVLLYNAGLRFVESVTPAAFLLIYFVSCIAGVFLVRSNSAGVSFLGYNLIVLPVGCVVAICVQAYGGLDAQIVHDAILMTAMTTFIMLIASIAFPSFFSKLGRVLFVALFALIIVRLLALLLFRSDSIWFSYIGATIFTLYLGYDFWASQEYTPTVNNAVDCATDIYLDIINLFLYILRILGKKK